jgi:hypothetical protein
MPVRDRMSEAKRSLHRAGLDAPIAHLALVLVAGLLLSSSGCTTRSEAPVWGPDSTLVYPSKLGSDVNASIAFQLKDSAARDAAKRRDRERGREISRLRREREGLLALEERWARERMERAEAERKAEAKKAAQKKGKKGKKSTSSGTTSPADQTPGGAARETRPGAPLAPAVRDSVAAIDARLAVLMAEDSAAGIAPWKLKRPDGKPAEERVFDIEEGARVQATIRLENVYARGKRPLMVHFVWLNAERKRVFKRMVEYSPNDSTQTLTSSMSLTPTKRSAGHYSLQVFLFREQIAEKWFDLRGKGAEEQEKGGGDAM